MKKYLQEQFGDMKKLINLDFLLGCCFICFMIGLAWKDAGTSYPAGQFEWYLPLVLLVLLAVIFVVGILAGRDSIK